MGTTHRRTGRNLRGTRSSRGNKGQPRVWPKAGETIPSVASIIQWLLPLVLALLSQLPHCCALDNVQMNCHLHVLQNVAKEAATEPGAASTLSMSEEANADSSFLPPDLRVAMEEAVTIEDSHLVLVRWRLPLSPQTQSILC
jgi:hypothetical protein